MIYRTVFCSFAILFSAAGLHAATLSVTSTSDAGPGSLRQAILDSNATASVQDTITFNIPGAGLQTISLTSALPFITDPVIIDGYTQPGASANTLAVGDDAIILIQLDGTAASANYGLNITAGESTVRGLAISGFSAFASAAITLGTNDNNAIEGCFIGTTAAGTAAAPNNNAIIIASNSSFNRIGGTTPARRNLISGNSGIAIALDNGATGNEVQGNYIGTDKNGAAKIGNGTGVHVGAGSATNNRIGGAAAGAGNVISGNTTAINLHSSGNVIAGNFIGTDATGTLAIGNTSFGVIINNGGNNTIGGPTAASRNVISAQNFGITIGGASDCVVQGNFIGTDVTGTRTIDAAGNSFGNRSAGVNVASGSFNCLVGGLAATPGEPPGNLISGNNAGLSVSGSPVGCLIQGNLIGTDITGRSALSNLAQGIVVTTPGATIGGTIPTACNVISGNGGIGIDARHPVSIQGNFIGTQLDGSAPLGNGADGVSLTSSNSSIGGTAAGAGNTIAFNEGVGIRVAFGSANTGNALSGNRIYFNAKLGIDLGGGNGVTPNDPGDSDSGSNNLQNFPVLTSVTNDGTNTRIIGTLNSFANITFRLEFFSNSVRDTSGFGPGENFIGASNVTTDGNGDASFNVVFPQGNDGQWFSATATDPNGNTSEFSAAFAATGPVILNTTAITARNGQRFKFRILTAGGNPSQRLSVTGLPPGLSANAVTGIISGTPTTDGSYNVAATVTDGAIITTSTLQIQVVSDPGLPVIVSSSVVIVPKGQAFSYQIEAPVTSLPTDPTTFSIIGTLPPGLTFNATTGVISGTVASMKSIRGGDEPAAPTLSGGTLLGIIQMFATNSRGRGTSPLVLLQLPPMAVNISTRLPVGTNENVLIGGFIVTGNAPKIVIIRAIGSSLVQAGLSGALQDPQLELRNESGGLLAFNDNWRTDQEAEIEETTIPPANEDESAIVAVLEPGSYTAILRGSGSSTGIAVVEAYDLGTASMDVASGAELANISTRGFVKTGNDIMIGGIISANGPARFIIRAIGPSLNGSGIQEVLQDPTLELRSANGTLLTSNDNWKMRPDGSSQQAEIEATTIPPTNDFESALVQMVGPGNYTAIVRGTNASTGVALIEVYHLP